MFFFKAIWESRVRLKDMVFGSVIVYCIFLYHVILVSYRKCAQYTHIIQWRNKYYDTMQFQTKTISAVLTLPVSTKTITRDVTSSLKGNITSIWGSPVDKQARQDWEDLGVNVAEASETYALKCHLRRLLVVCYARSVIFPQRHNHTRIQFKPKCRAY